MEPDEITQCLEQLGRQAKKAAAAASPTGARSGASAAAAAASQVGVGSPLSGVEGLYLPTYLYPPTERKGASSTPATPGPNREEGKMARALSPTGVDDIDAMLSGSGDGAARDGAEGGHQEVMLVA